MAGERSKKRKKKKKRKRTSISFITESRSTKKRKHLLELVEAGDVTELSEEIDSDRSLIEDVKQMGELLQMACERGLLDMAALLLRHDVSPDVLGEKEQSPLHVAVKRGHLSVMALLLSHGASINVRTKSEKRTPLHVAAIMGQETVASLLMENEADIDQGDIYGSCPLHLACQLGRTNMASLLLERGANVDVYDNEGWTGLHLAAEAGHSEVVRILLRHNVDVNQRTRYGRTALHWAVLREHLTIVRDLLEADINVGMRDAHDKVAAEYASHPSVQKLIKSYREKKQKYNMPLTLRGGAITGKECSVVGKMMSVRRPEFFLSRPELSSLPSDEDPGLSRTATASSLGTSPAGNAHTKEVIRPPEIVVSDAGDNLQASTSVESYSIYDPQPESERDNFTKSSPANPNVTSHNEPSPPSRGRSVSEEDIQRTTATGPLPLRLSGSLTSGLEGKLRLPLLNTSSEGQGCLDQEPPETGKAPPIAYPLIDGSSSSSGSSSHGDDVEKDMVDVQSLKITGSAREQLKALETSIEDLMDSTSKAMNKGGAVTAEFLGNLYLWGKETRQMLQALEEEMQLEQMTTVATVEEDVMSQPSHHALPFVLHCHFLSAASRHIDTRGAGWTAFVEKLSTELDKREGGSLQNVPHVIIKDTDTDTDSECEAHEVLFKLFRMAHCLNEPPIKYTLERCDMAGVDCSSLLKHFVKNAGMTTEGME